MEYGGIIPREKEGDEDKPIPLDAKEESSISCALCNARIGKDEIRFLLSSAELLELDLPIEERQVCISCYSSTKGSAVKDSRRESEEYVEMDVE